MDALHLARAGHMSVSRGTWIRRCSMMSARRREIAFLKLGGIEGSVVNSRRRGGQDCPPYVPEALLVSCCPVSKRHWPTAGCRTYVEYALLRRCPASHFNLLQISPENISFALRHFTCDRHVQCGFENVESGCSTELSARTVNGLLIPEVYNE